MRSPISKVLAAAFVVVLAVLTAAPARAQNPVQWSGNVQQAVARARELDAPLLFWVTQGNQIDDDDIADAQSDCFRDPGVVKEVSRWFVPVRVSRTSRVLEEAQKLGLPTTHGMYCAVITADGHVLAQIGPMEVADPAAFLPALQAAYQAHCDRVYDQKIKPVFDDPKSTKTQLREAARMVYRLRVRKADADVVNLLKRTDVTPAERGRLYGLLAALGTPATIGALLDRADDPEARKALGKVEADGLAELLKHLPQAGGEVTDSQLAAYAAATQAALAGPPKPKEWWAKADKDAREKELTRLQERAALVIQYAKAGRA